MLFADASTQESAIIAGLVAGLMTGAWTILQSWWIKRQQRPLTRIVDRIDANVNGKGQGDAGGTGLTAAVERVEKRQTASEEWQKGHEIKDEGRHDETMRAIGKLKPPEAKP